MSDITQRVFEMYQEYPFPGNVEYKMDYSMAMLYFLSKEAPKGKKKVFWKMLILWKLVAEQVIR